MVRLYFSTEDSLHGTPTQIMGISLVITDRQWPSSTQRGSTVAQHTTGGSLIEPYGIQGTGRAP